MIERAPSMPAKEEAQPLLEEEEGLPPTPATAATAASARGPALSKAIAIIRYIEAITGGWGTTPFKAGHAPYQPLANWKREGWGGVGGGAFTLSACSWLVLL